MLLTVDDLSISAPQRPLLRGIDLEITSGEIVGLVGASGSGKTLTALAICGALPDTLQRSGTITWNLPRGEANSTRRRQVSMIFQDPLQALDPTMTIGRALRLRLRDADITDRDAQRHAVAVALDEVGLHPATSFLTRYPHELSGGQRQRVLVAQGLIGNPALVIADEPTASLDDESSERTLGLLMRQIRERHASLLLITHDISVALSTCDRIAVMYEGFLVELASADTIRNHASHPYTRAIVAAARALEEGAVLEFDPPETASPVESIPLEGCPYRLGCQRSTTECARSMPEVTTSPAGGLVRCHHPFMEDAYQ
ncbi:MAG: ABC transporter ATP-binding protein [Acidimicrobiales bacterium]